MGTSLYLSQAKKAVLKCYCVELSRHSVRHQVLETCAAHSRVTQQTQDAFLEFIAFLKSGRMGANRAVIVAIRL